jgi:hypothetical protein
MSRRNGPIISGTLFKTDATHENSAQSAPFRQ